MRICDKCGRKHAYYKVRNWDFCEDCLTKLKDWVECTTCNKEHGEYVPSEGAITHS